MVKSYAGNTTWASSNDFDNLEVEIPHASGGSHREKIPIQKVNPIALYVSAMDTQIFVDDPTSAIEFLRMGLGLLTTGLIRPHPKLLPFWVLNPQRIRQICLHSYPRIL